MKLSSTFSLNEAQGQGKTNTSSLKFSNLSYKYLDTMSKAKIQQIKNDGNLMV